MKALTVKKFRLYKVKLGYNIFVEEIEKNNELNKKSKKKDTSKALLKNFEQ